LLRLVPAVSRHRSASLEKVLDYGGYDVAPMPLDLESLAPIVNGAFAVVSTVDSVAV
jgi:hypothetical protein